MMYFEEADQDFKLEKIKKRSLETKIRTLILLVIFLFSVYFIAKNDFKFDFLTSNSQSFDLVCSQENQISPSDDLELRTEKVRSVYNENKINLEKIDGYIGSRTYESPIGYKNTMRPVIEISLSKISSDNKIPEEICGINLITIYK